MKKKILLVSIIVVVGSLLLTILYSLSKPKVNPLLVISTVPKNNAVFVNEGSEVVLTLNRIIETQESDLVKVEITPKEKVNIVYLENKIRISPDLSFQLATNYKITVSYKNSAIYTLSFTTTPFSKEQLQEEGSKQTQGDLDFTKAYSELLDKYPWYKYLPIETSEYRIIYDFGEESFRIRFLVTYKDNEDKQRILNKALAEIEALGVKKPIKYYIIEKE